MSEQQSTGIGRCFADCHRICDRLDIADTRAVFDKFASKPSGKSQGMRAQGLGLQCDKVVIKCTIKDASKDSGKHMAQEGNKAQLMSSDQKVTASKWDSINKDEKNHQ